MTPAALALASVSICVLALISCNEPQGNPSLFPTTSLNRGDATIDLPDELVYDTFTSSAATVVLLEGVGSIGRGFDGGPVGPDVSRLFFSGYRDSAADAVHITDTRSVLDDTDGSGYAAPDLWYTDTIVEPDSLDGQDMRYTRGSFRAAQYYEYARYSRWDSPVDAETYEFSELVLGVSTAALDLPAAGEVTFTGDVLTTYRYSGGAHYRRGPASVTVDFGARRGTVTLRAERRDVFDEIESTDMVLTENGFTGGRIRIWLDGVDVTATTLGVLQGGDVAGLFFGPAEPMPAEVGGMVIVQGSEGSLDSYFIAD